MRNQMQNLLITGSRGSGKTTAVQRALHVLALQPCGFQTLPYTIEGQVRGHYFHSILPLAGVENNLPINVRMDAQHGVPIPQTFEVLGLPCLQQALQCDNPLMLLDEVGRIERHLPAYIATIQQALDSPKTVVAILKKEPIPFLEQLKAREDVMLIDLDIMGREAAYHAITYMLTQLLPDLCNQSDYAAIPHPASK